MAEHVLGVEEVQDGFAPVIEQGKWAGFLDQRPQPVAVAERVTRQKSQRTGIGFVRTHTTAVEQPEMNDGAEQGPPVRPRGALFEHVDIADENRGLASVLGDDLKLVEAPFVTPEGQACQEFLDGGVTGPDGQENEAVALVGDAGIGHEIRTFFDTIEQFGRRGCGHGEFPWKRKQHRPAGTVLPHWVGRIGPADQVEADAVGEVAEWCSSCQVRTPARHSADCSGAMSRKRNGHE